MQNNLELKYETYLKENIKKSVIEFEQSFKEINQMYQDNKSKNYKQTKLYYDLLKKYNAFDFKELSDHIKACYYILLAKHDLTYNDYLESIYNKFESESYSLTEKKYELYISFINFIKNKSRESNPIQLEVMIDLLDDFIQNCEEIEKEIINNSRINFLLNSLEISYNF